MVLRQLEERLAHQGAGDAEVIGKLLLCQFGAWQQLVLDDGAGQRLSDGGSGGGFHTRMIDRLTKSVYTFSAHHQCHLNHNHQEISLWASAPTFSTP
ncbi:hypothetical protein D3C72_1942340 [compost metagenome]